MFHLRPGEGGRVMWVSAIGVAYAAAVAIGNDVAESLFVTRVGAEQMPIVFLAKGVLDVVAASIYMPLARRRSERAVWLAALAIYAGTVLGGRALVTGGGDAGAFALFIGHETAWTILTIHWGVYILDLFDASQARRLFPLLFTTARVGGIFAGLLVSWLAVPLGVNNLLFFCAGFAGLAGAIALMGGRQVSGGVPRQVPIGVEAAGAGDDDEASGGGLWGGWRQAARSPLVRIIALSTAGMVLVRYGLHMVALDQINTAMEGDRREVARFLGTFGAIANAGGIVLGIFIVPKLLTRAGVGVANLLYAMFTVAAYAWLWVMPSLSAAVGARFVRVQLKDALKTPLSALFYGAEPPPMRAPARAFIFGAAIPAATVATAIVFEGGKRVGQHLHLVTATGLAVAVLFFAACWIQNRRWRRRLTQLLHLKLERADPPVPEQLALARELLADAGQQHQLLDDIARGLASPEPRLRAVAEEVLSETIDRKRAHAIALRVRSSVG